MKRAFTWLLVVCLAPYLTGCADVRDISLTGRLWSSDLVSNHDGPLSSPNLQVSQAADHKDFLVQYDEERDSDAKIKHRAYWLYANEPRIEKGRKPHFVNPRKAGATLPIAVETNSIPDAISLSSVANGAVLLSDHDRFTLVSNGTDLGMFRLPSYRDTASRAKLVALTPVAMVGDTVIYASIIAAVAAYIYAVGQATDPDLQTANR